MATWNLNDPRRMMGNNVDYEERINWDRLRKERLSKLQEAMKKHDFGALLLYYPGNIRYATSTRFLTPFTNLEFQRCALVPVEGQPILYEIIGVETEVRELNSPWIADHIRPHITWSYTGKAEKILVGRWADSITQGMKDLGVGGTRLGVDRVEPYMIEALTEKKLRWFDARDCLYEARSQKTRDEIECYKIVCSIHDACLFRANKAIEPGIRESDLAAIIYHTAYSLGAEYFLSTVVASGGHTNPYLREHTDKIIRAGDLVTIDFNMAATGGYISDFVRTFLCGQKATQQQKDLYEECYQSLYGAITEVKAGASTDQIAKHFPTYVDDKIKTWGMLQFGHGLGIVFYEPPTISRGISFEYPTVLKENMVLAFETYAGRPFGNEGVRLEENILVTKDGFEFLSLHPLEPKMTDKVQPKTAKGL